MGTDRNNHNVAPVMLEWQLIYYSIMQFNKQTTTSTDLLVLDTYPITSHCVLTISNQTSRSIDDIHEEFRDHVQPGKPESRFVTPWTMSIFNTYIYIYIYIYICMYYSIYLYIYKHAINPKSKFTKPTDDRASTKNHETFTIFAWIIIPIFFGRVV